MESWFTEPKLPLGRLVKIGITWLQDNAAGFFDAVTAIIDFLVDGCTAILLHVPFLVVVFAVAALAYWLHRSWRLAVFVVVAFIFIANLGYWQATVETISLVGFSTLASVADRRAARHRLGASAVALRSAAAAARPDADAADFRLSDPDARAVSSRLRARPDLDRDLRHRRADPPDPSRHRLGAAAAARKPATRSARRSGNCCGKWNCPTRCRRSWPASRNASC